MNAEFVKEYIKKENLLSAAEKVLVGLSGGADSVVLLNILLQIGIKCEAGHCNFHLRGAESLRDMAFVEDLCKRINVPLHIVHFNTIDYSKEKGISIEMAARELRYRWFDEIAKKRGCSKIAVGHHQNDQAETLLLNLTRGCGLKGLGGIRPKNGNIIRPLLCVTRNEIEEYALCHSLSFVADSTNADTSIRRNAFRGILSQLSNTDIKHIAGTATLMQQYYSLLDSILRGQPIQADAQPTLLFELLAPFGFNASQTEDIRHSLNTSGRYFESDSFVAVTDHGKIKIVGKEQGGKVETFSTPNVGIKCRLYKNEKYKRSETPYKVRSNEVPSTLIINKRKRLENEVFYPADATKALFDADLLPENLNIRYWKEGDYFIPLTNKSKPIKRKLQDLFSDNKLSVFDKHNIPIVCDAEKPDTIVWVVGLRQDNRFKVTSQTKTIAEIEVKEVVENV